MPEFNNNEDSWPTLCKIIETSSKMYETFAIRGRTSVYAQVNDKKLQSSRGL